ncbi:MAG TPA: ribonuclease H family protein [Chitinophagaceae bacterium]|jgi:ribonuclease HI|nr:ribonuclease H family protein [Chitinophagaceae bacterium]
MGKEKNNFYVVWNGVKPGVYSNWAECQKQIVGYQNAKYKGFKTQKLAQKAFAEGPENYWGKKVVESTLSQEELKRIGNPIIDSIVVDAAHSSLTNQVEYKGIYLKTGEVLFQKGPYNDGTNNIGEFLAIVHALAYLKKINSTIPVYSDSKFARGWVRDKEARTNNQKKESNKELFKLLERAVKWLKENKYPNKVLKWETKAWGENPADFGRK